MKINLYNKNQIIKWLLPLAIVLLVVIFLVRFIFLLRDRISPKKELGLINDNYKLELPIAEFDNYKISYEREYFNIYVVNPKQNSNKSKPIILFEGKEASFSDLEERLREFNANRYEYGYVLSIVNLFVDKEIKMSHFKEIKEFLQENTNLRISFAFKNQLNSYGLHDLDFFHCILPPPVDTTSDFFYNPPIDIEEELKHFSNVINISCLNSTKYTVNDTILSDPDLTLYIAKSIVIDTNYIVLLTIKKDQIFNDYFKMRIAVRNAIYQIRNDFSLQKYSLEYNLLDEEKQSDLRLEYPSRLLEIYEKDY